ncbi:MAG TPA: hypothetical protein VEK13_06065 [Thermoplasmata archaeon]|nr:hypothetical protein [Thermoplasmata archaeon]
MVANSLNRGFFWISSVGSRWILSITLAAVLWVPGAVPGHLGEQAPATNSTAPPSGAVANFTASINRLVELVAVAGSGLLALVWARVALSWFSNDLTKKVQAKDRARDALIGTLLFVAAITGLFWGLAQWVLTGS